VRETTVERLRAESGLSIDREGHFLHRGEPITHARTLATLWGSLERGPDGRYLVRVGRESAYVRVEDAPYAVRGVSLEGAEPILTLSDGTREPLAPRTLAIDPEGVLRCTVKGGHAARFDLAAQVTLGLAMGEDPPGGGRYVLTIGKWVIPVGSG
jgi:hypothetical protein